MSVEYPFGFGTSTLAAVGSVGIDRFGSFSVEPDFVSPGQKYPVDDLSQLDGLMSEYGITVDPAMDAAGLTVANILTGTAKINTGNMLLFTSVVPHETDSTTGTILDNLTSQGITVKDTPALGTVNPRSVVLPPEDQRRILTLKPFDMPAINMTPNGDRPGAVILCSAGGPWGQTWENAGNYAEATGAQTIVIGSESQIKQLDDPDKRRVYLERLRHSAGFLGNTDEAAMIIAASGGTPAVGDPERLARQMQGFGQEKEIVSLTYGPEGGVLLDRSGIVYTHTVPPRPKDTTPRNGTEVPFGKVTNVIGAGDQTAAVLIAGLRELGATPDAIYHSVGKAAEGSTWVVGRRDAQSGQLTRRQFFAPLHPQITVRTKEPRSWNFPAPSPGRARLN